MAAFIRNWKKIEGYVLKIWLYVNICIELMPTFY